jgi:hypothetical protein
MVLIEHGCIDVSRRVLRAWRNGGEHLGDSFSKLVATLQRGAGTKKFTSEAFWTGGGRFAHSKMSKTFARENN